MFVLRFSLLHRTDNLLELVPLLGGSQELNSGFGGRYLNPLNCLTGVSSLSLNCLCLPSVGITDQHSHCGGTTLSSWTWGCLHNFSLVLHLFLLGIDPEVELLYFAWYGWP